MTSLAGKWVARTATAFAAIVLILAIYFYPFLKTRAELGPTILPPMSAPDLPMYLNLSRAQAVNEGRILDPYYGLEVPSNGTGYLKFRLATSLFSALNSILGQKMWLALFVWNLCWWGLACVAALWLFRRYLPMPDPGLVVLGIGLLMLIPFGMARPLFSAWLHLPSVSGFQNVGLPYMRAFSPQISIPLLLGYLGLQMGVLQQRGPLPWIAMGGLQFFALTTFPYATLMMAGFTAVSALWQVFIARQPGAWRAVVAYGAGCAIADVTFLKYGSLSFYASPTSALHFQPQLVSHLVGGAWILLALLTAVALLNKTLPPQVKWPLVGFGATNLLFMLGDAVVPATTLLLSQHSAYFMPASTALLVIFLISAALTRVQDQTRTIRSGVYVAFGLVAINGMLLAAGTYRAFLPANREQVALARLLSLWQPAEGDLVIARAQDVDDACGWVPLLSRQPVLFCPDAEVMLTPQQNRDIHRFRQALYLYFTGRNSHDLEQAIASPQPEKIMYQLGYWAESVSFSQEERNQGIHAIKVDLIPLLTRVENRDHEMGRFFQQFRRIVVIDDLQHRTFVPEQLGSFLKTDEERRIGNLLLRFCSPE